MDKKPWYQSMTIRGGIISVLTGALMFLPIELPDNAQAQVAEYVTVFFNVVGFIMVIVGRLRASSEIGK